MRPQTPPLVTGRQEQGRALRPPVEEQERARHLDAGQVVELVVLAKPHVGRILGRSLQHGEAVSHPRKERGTPGGELRRRRFLRKQRPLGSSGRRERQEQDGRYARGTCTPTHDTRCNDRHMTRCILSDGVGSGAWFPVRGRI